VTVGVVAAVAIANLKKACGTREKPKCVPAGSEKESKNNEKGRRFEAANPEMLASLAKPYGPKNTQLNTQWVMNSLRDWRRLRYKEVSGGSAAF